MMSQARAISKPPPMATPLTAAITGLVRSYRAVSPANPDEGWPLRSPPPAWYFRSLPALKARPAPVTIATHSSGSAANSSNTSDSSALPGG